MRRLLFISLLFAALFALTACGNGGPDRHEDSDTWPDYGTM